MLTWNALVRSLRNLRNLRSVNKTQDVFLDSKRSLRRELQKARTMAWHYRKGGMQQVKIWRWNQVAQQSNPQRKTSLPDGGLRRDYTRLRNAWIEKTKRSQTWAPASETHNYRNVFAQGWFLGSEGGNLSLPPTWVSTIFGEKNFSCDPTLQVVHRGSSQQQFQLLLLGQASDSAKKLRNGQQVATELYSVLKSNPHSWKELDEAVTWLGGRFVVIARKSSEIRVHVDAMASRSCYWGTTDAGDVVLASHSALIAQATGDLSSTKAKWVLNHPDYHNPAGVYLPGTITSHDRARLIFANCCLSIKDGAAEHQRFFPPQGTNTTTALSAEAAAEAYLAEVRFQMDVILTSTPESVIALTAGSDSRAILNASLDLLQDAGTSAMTYHFFDKNAEHTRTDLLGANRLAEEAGLKHRILNLKPWDPKARFAKLYTQTFPVWARFGALARACYEGLSAEEALIIGVGGEVGTAFYLDRQHPAVTPEVLAGKFTQDNFQHDAKLIAEFENYMEYTQLAPEFAGNIDLYDLFYWEHRMSGWAAYWYSELDFGPIVALPLNSRRIFCAMLSVPFEDRVRKSVYGTLNSWVDITAESTDTGGKN